MKWLLERFGRKKHKKSSVNEISFISDPLQRADLLIRRKRPMDALSILNRVKAEKIPVANTDLLRAHCFIATKRPLDAFEAVKEELRYFPDNRAAEKLLIRLEKSQEPATLLGGEEFEGLHKKVRRFTMLGSARLHSLYELSKSVCLKDVPGHFVECGVAAGGSSALLAAVIKKYSQRRRYVFALDTFTGMPEASSVDRHGSASPEDIGWGTGTCAAHIDSLLKISQELGVSDLVIPMQGLFADTLPLNRDKVGPIAFLHMDGDWYSSTKDILENLFDQVVESAIIQIDDYGFWEGCAKAVKEFQQARGLHFTLNRIDETGVWMRKEKVNLRLLNLGCGNHMHPDWINVDISPNRSDVVKHDLRFPLPFKDHSFDVVYHSHALEHLPRSVAKSFIRECYRVLVMDGILRVVVPDLETITRLYLKYLDATLLGEPEASSKHEWMTIELLDQMVRERTGGEMRDFWRRDPLPAEDLIVERLGEEFLSVRPKVLAAPELPTATEAQIAQFQQSGELHKWMYDRISLKILLESCGFKQVSVQTADKSNITNFNSYLLDITPNGMARKPDSLFVEARKA